MAEGDGLTVREARVAVGVAVCERLVSLTERVTLAVVLREREQVNEAERVGVGAWLLHWLTNGVWPSEAEGAERLREEEPLRDNVNEEVWL